jgi:transketolase
MTEKFDCRDAFSSTLERLVKQDERIVAVVNDSVGSSKINNIKKNFPERLVNVGIAEQDLIGVAAGLSNGGKIPFVCGAACFITARSLEQVKVDMAYSNNNVKLCGMSSGVAYGELGPTHHSIEDFAWTRVIDNLTIIVPADPAETEQAVLAVAEKYGPVYLRISRMPVPAVNPQDYQFEIGKAVKLREGSAATVIANGVMVTVALQAAELLAAEGISVRVLNMATLKPLDVSAVVQAARDTRHIVTIEEASIYGGLGSAVAEVVVQKCPVPMRILGFPVFAPTGSAEWLFDHFGLTASGIQKAVKEILVVESQS